MSTDAAWSLVQVGDLIRRAQELHLTTLGLLGVDVRGEIPDATDVVVTAATIAVVAASIADAAEIAEQLQTLAQALPHEDVHVTYETVRTAAAADLSAGVLDPHRAIAAARVLDVKTGWPALADALRSIDISESWDEISLVDVVGRFRGAERDRVRRVLDDAGLSPDQTFADCSPEGMVQLAIVLDDYARGWQGGPRGQRW